MNPEQFVSALNDLRQLQQNILTYQLDAADLYLEDIHGDWLENWGEDENITETLISFLESNDDVAVTVRQRLGEKTNPAIAEELEKCLNLVQTDEQIVAVRKILSEKDDSRLAESSSNGDDVELLNLAETLLERLEEIFKKECL